MYLCTYFRVRISIRIFVRIWTYTVRICTYPSPYLHISQFVSARIPVRICRYLSAYVNVYQYESGSL